MVPCSTWNVKMEHRLNWLNGLGRIFYGFTWNVSMDSKKRLHGFDCFNSLFLKYPKIKP